MNIVVCLKQVPGITEVKIDPQTNTLVREGIKNIVNPFDAYALEEGVRIKERYGGRVTAISMGPAQAEEVLREAIATGADDAILLSDGAFAGADTLATACTLAVRLPGRPGDEESGDGQSWPLPDALYSPVDPAVLDRHEGVF